MTEVGKVTGAIEVQDQFSSTFGKAGKGLKVLKVGFVALGAAVVAVGAALVAMTAKALANADALDNQAKATQSSAESLQIFNIAAEQAGQSANSITGALQRLQRNIGEPTKLSSEAFQKLGLDINNLKNTKPEDVFRLIFERLDTIPNAAEKTAVAMTLLGRAGANLLALAGDGLPALEERYRSLGLVLSNEVVAAVDKTEEEFDFLKRATASLSTNIGSAVGQSEALRSGLIFLTEVMGGFSSAVQDNNDDIVEWLDTGIAQGLEFLTRFSLGVNEVIGVFDKWKLSLDSIAEQITEIQEGGDPFNSKVLAEGLAEIDARTSAVADTIIEKYTVALRKAREGTAALNAAAAETPEIIEGTKTQMEFLQFQLQDMSEETFPEFNTNMDLVASGVMNAGTVVSGAFERMGIKTRSELARIATQAEQDFNTMRESGEASFQGLEEAHEKMIEARLALEETANEQTTLGFGEALSTAGDLLRTFAGKSKSIALATAIIDGIMAVQKAWASAPFPFNLPAVAVVTAATIGNVVAIKSQGFRHGTPGLDFQNFGTSTNAVLHGREAVIPQGSGNQLAGEIAAAQSSRGSSGGGGDTILMLDGMVLAKWLEKNSKSGRVRIHASSVRDF